jgi:hypothetical protein
VSPGHCALVVHGPQVSVVVSQTSGGTQFAFVMHSTQVFVVGLQIGVSPGHCTLSVHVVPQVPVTGLQIGAFAGQSEFCVHSTQVFVAGLQIGVSPGHCTLVVHVAVQVFVAGSQIGMSSGHCELSVQPTQVLLDGSQTGSLVGHPVGLATVHSTQTPGGKTHTGVFPPQSLSVVQAGTQSPVVGLQTSAPVQSAVVVHSTQRLVVVLQTGLAGVQASSFVALHSTQSPFPRHAGSACVGHAADALLSLKSPLQGTHWCVVVLQTDVVGVPAQSALERQPGTQTLFEQIGLAGVHAVRFVAEHSRHAPATHAGLTCVGHARVAPLLKSPLQPRHWPPTQTGTPSGHVWPALQS